MPRTRDSAWFFGTQPKLIGSAYLTNEEDVLDALERELHDKVRACAHLWVLYDSNGSAGDQDSIGASTHPDWCT